jgi:hypothetical protein
VVPHVEKTLSSFVHDHLEKQNMLGEYTDNRPRTVRCIHPLVTLFEKLDAMSRRYLRDPIEPDTFVRHYEDVAQIIRAVDQVPAIEMSAAALAQDMLQQKDIATLPSPDEPALLLAEANKRQAVERALTKIDPMFWGTRIPLDNACGFIRTWLGELERNSVQS